MITGENQKEGSPNLRPSLMDTAPSKSSDPKSGRPPLPLVGLVRKPLPGEDSRSRIPRS